MRSFLYGVYYNVRYLRFDKTLLFATLSLSFIGVLSIYAASNNAESEGVSILYLKQLLFIAIGFVMMFVFSIVNYRKLAEHSKILFVLCVVFLLLPFAFGKVINNAKRWIDFGPFTVQPSEFAKIVLIVVIAKYLEHHRAKMNSPRYIALLFLIVAAPMLVIMAQPDLGTSLVLMPILFVILFFGGVRIEYFFYLFCVGVFLLAIPFASAMDKTQISHPLVEFLTNPNYVLLCVLLALVVSLILYFVNVVYRSFILKFFMFLFLSATIGLLVGLFVDNFVLKDYQKGRLLAFVNPYFDKLNTGYNVIQAQIAVGSGRLFGHGFLKGMQGYLGFLPSRTTDFIFSIISEEFGFAGSSLVLGLFMLVIYRLFRIALEVKDYLGGLIVAGLSMLVFFQASINIAMNVGLAPITGVPLPFLSYGGSSIISLYIGVGIVQNIYNRKYINRAQTFQVRPRR